MKKEQRSPLAVLFLAILFSVSCGPSHANRIVIGSKNFTESLMLGELLAQQIEAHSQLKVERRFYLAGTYICQQAMLSGRIDIYPEYTGTAPVSYTHLLRHIERALKLKIERKQVDWNNAGRSEHVVQNTLASRTLTKLPGEVFA